MKAAVWNNRRGTVHEWRSTGVAGYMWALCSPGRQIYRSDLQSSPGEIAGLPDCKVCARIKASTVSADAS